MITHEPWFIVLILYLIGLGPALMVSVELDKVDDFPLAAILLWPLRLFLVLVKQTIKMIIYTVKL